MRFLITSLLFCLAVVTAVPAGQSRIAGGSTTTINQYPYVASMIYSRNGGSYSQACVGSIINNRSILSAASCYANEPINRWRIRVGSTNANSGGSVHKVHSIIINSGYNALRRENDIAIVRSSTNFRYSNSVRAISLANTGYYIPDNAIVWALGWGRTGPNAAASKQLRQVQIWTINYNTCRNNYASANFVVTNNMICSGWLNVGNRGQCDGDEGGPLVYNNVLVGVYSWARECASSHFPSINTKVSNYIPWITSNA
ncbi:trypsin CFT-1-like [Colias croceus]|uniref:trypsin CFT-1-like n=1 Tax=Colias crocea TaxID=72248 RepID=UPI001E28038D|nr:trypsin CFT-1-like [Colias croceus]